MPRLLRDHIELHGDRVRGEDESVRIGLAWAGDRRCAYVESSAAEFTPISMGKAARIIRLAEQLSLPVVFLDAAISLWEDADADLMETAIAARVPFVAASRDEGREVPAPELFDAVAIPATAESLATTLHKLAESAPADLHVARLARLP